MPITIFFSWQLDRDSRAGRDLIERALERAAAQISADTTIEKAVREIVVDRDTLGVAGSPPIVDTIFRKVDKAAIFVPDLTFVGTRVDGRPAPNPNVMIEYGWALKSLTYSRIVPVMNTAFGKPTAESMPFDMRHLRHPTTYLCSDDLDDSGRAPVIENLAKELEQEIRAVLDSDEFRSAQPQPPEPPRYVEKSAVDGRGRFKPSSEPIGIESGGGFLGGLRELFLSPHPVVWFRMMPSNDPGRTWSVDELESAMKSPFLAPLSRDWRGFSFLRTHEGYGVYSFLADQREAIRSLVFVFTTGEVWSADTYWLEAYGDDKGRLTVPNEEQSFRKALVDYGQFLNKLGVIPPFRWIAGMENLKGRVLYAPARPGYYKAIPGPDGKCTVDVISETGIYAPGDAPGKALKSFFAKLYNACGVSREDWRDD